MKKQEFLKYLDDLGLTTDFLGIHIGDKPDYSPYYREFCYKDGDVWVRYIIDERCHMTVFNKSDEDECFNQMKALLPDSGIHNVQKNGAYKLYEKFPLSPLGAFNYINYLIENPDAAMKNLKIGLKNKDMSMNEKKNDYYRLE